MMQGADLKHEGIGAVNFGSCASYGTSIEGMDMKRILKGRTPMLSFSARFCKLLATLESISATTVENAFSEQEWNMLVKMRNERDPL